YFEWNKYIKIYNDNVSLITETCLGGGISNILGLPFCSPFVNVRVGIEKDDYFELIEKLDYYMEQPPAEIPKLKYTTYNWNGWEGRINFPKLWYDDIMIHGFHYNSQRDFFEQWEKRRKRYNSEKKVIFKILYDQEDIEKFQEIKFSKKIGFYHKKVDCNNIVSIYSDEISGRYSYQYSSYLFDLLRCGVLFQYVDFFSLLSEV
ncbi:DUF1919 domain-containing protein, partial [Clostridiaceae bacterium]|nr:DUF1919 domain-containing protein [Clostridiaceae bacterium]